MSDNYYISFVVATRNDNHGGNMKQKNQFFIDRWCYITAKYNLACELIIVDWNPLEENSNLQTLIKFPRLNKNQKIRIIKVPYKYHNIYKSSSKLNFYQMQAKNVGIRRAKGKFILCTNIDIIFSDEIIKFLSKKNLDENKVYRTDRYDIDFNLFENINKDSNFFMSYCTGIHKKIYSIDLKTNKKYFIYRSIVRIFYEETIDFILSLINIKKKNRTFSIFRPILFPIKLFIKFPQIFNKLKKFLSTKSLPKLHTNGCGDFTLASDKVWRKCCGYYEYDGYSFFVDSLFIYLSYFNGFRIIELKEKIFHVNHSGGFLAGSDELFNSLSKKAIPHISYEEFLEIIKNYENKKFNLSNEKWGLKDELLDEFKI